MPDSVRELVPITGERPERRSPAADPLDEMWSRHGKQLAGLAHFLRMSELEVRRSCPSMDAASGLVRAYDELVVRQNAVEIAFLQAHSAEVDRRFADGRFVIAPSNFATDDERAAFLRSTPGRLTVWRSARQVESGSRETQVVHIYPGECPDIDRLRFASLEAEQQMRSVLQQLIQIPSPTDPRR